MRQLYLMRHGAAEASASGGDGARDLTPAGRRAVEEAAAGLRAIGVQADAIWHSPFNRAAQTAELVGAVLGCGPLVENPGLIPNGAPERMADELRLAEGSILVASHLPLLPALTESLLGAPVQLSFSTATVAHLSLVGRGAAYLSGMWSAEVLAAAGQS